MTKNNLKSIKVLAQKEIERAKNLKELNEVFKKHLGKKGELSLILRSLKKLTVKERKKIGKEANELKDFLRTALEKKAQILKKQVEEKEKEVWVDVTLPGEKIRLGHLHPLTLVRREIEEIFKGMGFSVVLGPDIENEWYNFDALNIPKEHPARDLWDTLWLRSNQKSQILARLATDADASKRARPNPKSQKLLLRTHTSPVQIRYMEKHRPPLRIIVPGRCFRHEATDASHEFQLHQLEGLMVGKEVSAAHFKAIIQEFFKRFFKKPIKVRLRPDYFPFTEPSFDVSITCTVCGGEGCSVCSGTGWLEMMGAGMVHPAVFKNSGLNPKYWQGFAFGMGLDRLAMMKYKINDIRLFRSGDLRFLQQF